jgi:hypothetical protein
MGRWHGQADCIAYVARIACELQTTSTPGHPSGLVAQILKIKLSKSHFKITIAQ